MSVIPSRHNVSVVLDSNELICLLNSAAELERLTRWLRERPATIFVPGMVLAECFPQHASEERLSKLVALARSVAPQIQSIKGVLETIRKEQQEQPQGVTRGDISLSSLNPKTPSQWAKLARAFATTFSDTHQIKMRQFLRERGLHEENDGLGNNEIAALLSSSDGDLPIRFVWSALADAMTMHHPADVVLAAPARFPVLTLFAHLLARHAWANVAIVDPRRPGRSDRVIGLFRTKSEGKGGMGAWADIEITAVAAKADVLVTSDRDLRERCNFLRDLKLVSFRTRSLRELLSGK